MTSEKQSDNLSGFWTDVYDYPDGHREPVPFNAVIEDVTGTLASEIVEPNTLSSAKDRELFASLSGTRQGSSVHFIKSYQRVPNGGHSIDYEGVFAAAGTRIDGTWPTTPPAWPLSGPFVMNRSGGKNVAADVKAGRELEVLKRS